MNVKRIYDISISINSYVTEDWLLMISQLTCVDYCDSACCTSQLFQSRESFGRNSYDFRGGNVYGIVSDFGCGSWGLVTSLGGKGGTDSLYSDGDVLLDGVKASPEERRIVSAFVGDNIFDGINSPTELLSARKCIEKALQISGLRYSPSEIKDVFSLSDERYERDLKYVSGEIFRISIAINFALGKSIYCFPWANEHDIMNILHISSIIGFLKKNNKIILIPTSQEKTLKKYPTV